MSKVVVLDLVGVVRLAALALTITATLGLLLFLGLGQLIPILRFSATIVFLPWIAGGILVAIWMTLLQILVRRMRFGASSS